MNPTIYVLTHLNNQKVHSIDPFLNSTKNYVYYLINKTVPDILKDKKCVIEYDLDPLIFEAGKKYLAEWSFLLNEAKHSFCEYPLFMISSRFYEKNHWLLKSLDYYWDNLFNFLQKYNFGYLPRYDRLIR